jgi:cytochrome c oxidase subunit 2
VPELNKKVDAIPGHPNSLYLYADKPGVYRGQCAEFCGVFHARMLLSVRAVSRADYDAWLTTAPRPSLAPIPLPSPSGDTTP